MPLADYLAQNYLSADGAKASKKRKRKHAEASGLTIADDSASGWNKSTKDDDDDELPLVVPNGHLTTSKRKTTWKTYGSAAPSNSDQAAADAILANAAAEKQTRIQDEDDAPAVVDGDGNEYDYGLDDGGPQMTSGAKAGLQTAEQITAQLKKREREEKKRMEDSGLDPNGKAQETIYRDASGRIINVAMKRAELRRKAEEDEKKKNEDLEARRGDVQRREKEERARKLDEAKFIGVSRYADDVEMNEELKEKERWNDPAMRFLSNATKTKGTKTAKSNRKTYQGPSEPNRYGIKPGYRWDGVDRSNQFERKWFAARNAQTSRKDLEYAWEMDE